MKYGFNSGGPWLVSVDRKPTKEYSRWTTMMARCHNPISEPYPDYGAKGITVHPDWHDYQVFAQWYSENHREGWQMDKDLYGGMQYGPETCVFVPEPINQALRFMGRTDVGVKKVTARWWAVHLVNADGEKVYHGKIATREQAEKLSCKLQKQKMTDLIARYHDDLDPQLRIKLDSVF